MTKRLMQSSNPVIRARATLNRFRDGNISLRFLADAIMRDCTNGNKINHKAFSVYQKFFEKFRLDAGDKYQMKQVFFAEIDRQNDPGHAVVVLEIMDHLGIHY